MPNMTMNRGSASSNVSSLKLVTDTSEIMVQLRNLDKGQEVVYFSGHLAEARGTPADQMTEMMRNQLEVAKEVDRLYEMRQVTLFQRRRSDSCGFDYIARGTGARSVH